MVNVIVNEKYDNKKIVNFILSEFPNLSYSYLYKALRKKDILVNGKRINSNINIKKSDKITIYIVDDILYGNQNTINLDIVYEDKNILILNKPTGISVLKDNSNSKTSFSDIVNNYCPNAKPCHRLDRNTSGLIIYAKNNNILEILLEKFKNREIEKYYKAVVYGIPNVKEAQMQAYLFKDNKKSIVYISDTFKKGYKKILTTYKILDTNKKLNISLLDINLGTGRTHQIRAHLAHIGLPILGDGKYGINSINKKFKEKHQLLISYKIKFNFLSDAKKLNYLNNKIFEIPVNYKYFNSIET